MAEARVISLYVGRTKDVEIDGRAERTAFVRSPATSPIQIEPTGIEGNEFGTGRRLGTLNHAIYLLNAEHYDHYENILGRAIAPGSFAENVTYQGPDETVLRMGDQLRIGTAVVELTLPRIPCYKMAHFFNADAGFPSLFSLSGRTGIYARVIKPGAITPDDKIEIIRTDPSNALISELNVVLTAPSPSPDMVERVKASPALFDALRQQIDERMELLGIDAEPQATTVRITDIRHESRDVVSVAFSMPVGTAQPPKPGQFTTFGITDNNDAQHFRCYSLIEAPFADQDADDSEIWRIAVRKQANDNGAFSVSSWIHENLKLGDLCAVYPPAGEFVLPHGLQGPVAFIAGGIGITPILAQIAALARQGYSAHVTLIYVAPDAESLPFLDALHLTAAKLPKFDLRIYLTRVKSLPTKAKPNWKLGYPDFVRDIAALGEADHVFVCGPAGMIDAVRTIHNRLGRLNKYIHFELFANDGLPTSLLTGINTAQITIRSTGFSGTWNAEDGSLLNWIEARTDIRPNAACRSGMCRTCRADLIRGEVAYPPTISPPPASSILLCCAHPASDLEIDLPSPGAR